MDISHLRYVVAIARLRSFSRAAEVLYVSQSSLSQQIAKLEKEIGYPLFQRTTKHVQLTEEGIRFLTLAKQVLAKFDALQEQVEATRSSMEHTINLGCSVIYRPDTSKAIVQFIQTHPEINFNQISAWELDLMEMLHNGRIDLALFGIDRENDDLTKMNVLPVHDEFVVATMSPNHPLAGRESVSLAELANETLIFTSERSGVRRLILHRFRQMGVRPERTMVISETETRIHYVSQNIGVAFTMSSTYHWMGRDDIRRVLIEPRMVRTYSLVSPEDSGFRHPAAIQLFQEYMLENLRGSKRQDTLCPPPPDSKKSSAHSDLLL